MLLKHAAVGVVADTIPRQLFSQHFASILSFSARIIPLQ